MIARNAVNGAVLQSLLKQFNIDLGSQRWLHLKLGIKVADMVLGKGEVHRADFAGHRRTKRLHQPYNLDRSPGADAHDVNRTTGM